MITLMASGRAIHHYLKQHLKEQFDILGNGLIHFIAELQEKLSCLYGEYGATTGNRLA